ncbi:MAG: hypothetical protein ACLPKE_02905 [Streptosporangiaceae bacterium]
MASIRVKSRSRRDIRTTDFENGDPLRFSLGSPVLRTLDTDTGGEAMPQVPIDTEGSAVLVGPGLIKKGQVISIDLLTDGPVTLTCPSPALADVTVRRQDEAERLGLIQRITGWAVAILIVVWIVADPTAAAEDVHLWVSSTYLLDVLVPIAVPVAVVWMIWMRASRTNRRR